MLEYQNISIKLLIKILIESVVEDSGDWCVYSYLFGSRDGGKRGEYDQWIDN